MANKLYVTPIGKDTSSPEDTYALEHLCTAQQCIFHMMRTQTTNCLHPVQIIPLSDGQIVKVDNGAKAGAASEYRGEPSSSGDAASQRRQLKCLTYNVYNFRSRAWKMRSLAPQSADTMVFDFQMQIIGGVNPDILSLQ